MKIDKIWSFLQSFKAKDTVFNIEVNLRPLLHLFLCPLQQLLLRDAVSQIKSNVF